MKRGLTQQGLAKKAGLSLKSVKNWEKRGTAPPKDESQAKLARALGVPLLWLTDGAGEEPDFTTPKAPEIAVSEAPSSRDYDSLMQRFRDRLADQGHLVAETDDPVAEAHALLDDIDAAYRRQIVIVARVVAFARKRHPRA